MQDKVCSGSCVSIQEASSCCTATLYPLATPFSTLNPVWHTLPPCNTILTLCWHNAPLLLPTKVNVQEEALINVV